MNSFDIPFHVLTLSILEWCLIYVEYIIKLESLSVFGIIKILYRTGKGPALK